MKRWVIFAFLILALSCGGPATAALPTLPATSPAPTPTDTKGVPPTGTPRPTAGPTSAASTSGCNPDATFEADVTIPDNTQIAVGQSFVKTWRVRNTGTCDWGAGYHWTFVEGEQMSGPDAAAIPETPVGESADISVELTAPRQEGTYRGIGAYVWAGTASGTEYTFRSLCTIRPGRPQPHSLLHLPQRRQPRPHRFVIVRVTSTTAVILAPMLRPRPVTTTAYRWGAEMSIDWMAITTVSRVSPCRDHSPLPTTT